MTTPLVCWGCGKVVAPYVERLLELTKKGKTPAEALSACVTRWDSPENHVYIDLKQCCSRTIMGTDDKISFIQLIERVQLAKP